MIRWRRSEREAFDAAGEVFSRAGWPFREDIGGKHKLCVVTLPDGSEFRLPVCNSPSRGVTGAVNLARWSANKLVRRFGAMAA
jgi:hypothetical protein